MKEYKVKLIFDSTEVNAPGGGSAFGGRQGGTKSDPTQNRVLPPVVVGGGGLGSGAAGAGAAAAAGAASGANQANKAYEERLEKINEELKRTAQTVLNYKMEVSNDATSARWQHYQKSREYDEAKRNKPESGKEKTQAEQLKEKISTAFNSVLKTLKGDFKGGAEGFSKLAGGGKGGKALGWAAVAATITAALITLTKAIWGLNNKFSQYSNTAAAAQAKQEMFMNRFGKAMGAMTGPLSNVMTSIAKQFLPLIEALSELLGVVFNLVDILAKLSALFYELTGMGMIMRGLSWALSYVNKGLHWLGDKLDKLLNFFDVKKNNHSLLISEMGRISGIDPNKPLPNNPNNPAPAPNPNNPQPNNPQPIPAPVAAAASPAFYFGMMNNIETRRHVDEAVAKMREQLLYTLNKAETEQEMFVNELKSINYIRTL